MQNMEELADHYVGVWNVTGDEQRRKEIALLWDGEAEHYTPSLEIKGHAALETRVKTSHERNVRDGRCLFRREGPVMEHHGIANFAWVMLSQAGEVEARGSIVLVLAADGRIARDYQFFEPDP